MHYFPPGDYDFIIPLRGFGFSTIFAKAKMIITAKKIRKKLI